MRREFAAPCHAIALSVVLLIAGGCASGRRDFDPKHDGRWLRLVVSFPLTPFVYSWMGYHILTEDRGPQEANFSEATVYIPKNFEGLSDFPGADERTRDLFRKYAPIIVQETSDAATYDPSIDRIGTPRSVAGDSGKKRVEIDTESPALFVFVSHASIEEQDRLQLNYVYWFPEHPSADGGFDPEAGKIEGLTLRITLGQDDRPIFYETVYNCGCYHRVYPAEHVERKAKDQFGPPKRSKYTSVQKKVRFKIDLYAPEQVKSFDGERVAIFSQAGRHYPLAIEPESHILTRAKTVSQVSAALLPYDVLETGGPDGLGIFNPDKLVAGADRAESWMLFPTGLYHAGTPRRRGSQLIHFDQYDFDDPRLLEKHLRIPSGI